MEIPKGEVRYTLGREYAPVATVEPGTRLRIETELNIGDHLHSPSDAFGPRPWITTRCEAARTPTTASRPGSAR